MPLPSPSAGDANVIGCQLKRISPDVSLKTPANTLVRVDLPAPFSPSSAWISPGLRSKSTFLKAGMLPKLLVPSRISRIGATARHSEIVFMGVLMLRMLFEPRLAINRLSPNSQHATVPCRRPSEREWNDPTGVICASQYATNP